jgi:polyphosphate kinase
MTAVRPAPGPRAAARGRRRSAREERHPILNRELSWLEFNARVLAEAEDPGVPLYERIKFLSIVTWEQGSFALSRLKNSPDKHPDVRPH